MALVKRIWVPLVMVLVIALASVAVVRLHGNQRLACSSAADTFTEQCLGCLFARISSTPRRVCSLRSFCH
ncbi:MAG TPA: MmpS family transport accessory protein [Mycobacterium sp.]|uniref:MmpS family transport accessory protein n=1 Tax=Mycobacterium sp. TaxID=1785 RepID=UPI002D5C3965|nr:MmpS family transport accessory protein [Mycobacterium sp.]HZU46951.1 MmpS family transport accessory protein [Mycobacterium sp.]